MEVASLHPPGSVSGYILLASTTHFANSVMLLLQISNIKPLINLMLSACDCCQQKNYNYDFRGGGVGGGGGGVACV